MSRRPKATWRCRDCGSDAIEGLAWAGLNTKRVSTWEEHGEYWCSHCETHVKRICEVFADGHCQSHERAFAACRATPKEDS